MMLKKMQFVVAGLLFAGLGSQAQTATVTGDISGLGDDNLTVHYYNNNNIQKTDTVKAKDGKFKWQANISEPQKIVMMFPRGYTQFFVEKGNIQIAGTSDALDKLKVTGSKSQAEADAFDSSLKDLNDQQSPLYEKWGKGSEAEQLALETKLNDIRAERAARTSRYIESHPNSALSLSMVSGMASMGAYNEVKEAYGKLSKSAQQTAEGKRLADRLVVLKRSAIGEQMLDFTQNDTQGKPVKFSDFKGKYVLVDFWASWCGPCRAENPNVLKAYNKYKDKNFTVVGLSLDDKAENWKKAIEEDGMPWTELSDLKGWKNEVSTYYGIMGIPSTLLVDPQGKIIAKGLRGATLNKKLAELFD